MVIVGCGYLADIVTGALLDGFLPGYNLVGVYSRTVDKAERLATKMHEQGRACKACTSLDELLALNPHFLVKPRPGRYERGGLLAKKWNIHYHPSPSALLPTPFTKRSRRRPERTMQVYIASGATPGL